MKHAVLLITFLYASISFAENPSHEANFEIVKQDTLKEVDARLGEMQKLRSCIQGANHHEAIKECREQMRRDQISNEKARMDERIKKLQEERAKLDQRGVMSPTHK